MGNRIALLVSSHANDLTAGMNDLSDVFHFLRRDDIGSCDSTKSSYLTECKNSGQFDGWLGAKLNDWNIEDQLVFYYTGHGIMVGEHFALSFEDESGKKDIKLFQNLVLDIRYKWGVSNVLYIIDACHSGALAGNAKGHENIDLSNLEYSIPKGTAYLLSSANKYQRSYENKISNNSVFSELFVSALKTGLNGLRTLDGLIGVEDILVYINSRLNEAGYKKYNQRAISKVNILDGRYWIAKNISGRINDHNVDLESVELSYRIEDVEFAEQAVLNAEVSDLDDFLLNQYLERAGQELQKIYDKNSTLEKLRVITDNGVLNKERVPTVKAVLCLSKNPEIHYPFMRTRVLFENKSGKYVLGSIPDQIIELLDIFENNLNVSLVDKSGVFHTDNFKESRLFQVTREVLSNAYAHRDYSNSNPIKVIIDSDKLTICSPGKLYTNFSDLIKNAVSNVSFPVNPALNEMMLNMGMFEGFGRGFLSVKKHIDYFGREAIQYTEGIDQSCRVVIRVSDDISGSNDIASPSKVSFNRITGKTIVLFGPPAVGKSILIARLFEYLTKIGYNVDVDSKFRNDEYYDEIVPSLGSAIIDSAKKGNFIPRNTTQGAINFNIYRNGKKEFNLVDLPGEHTPPMNSTSYPNYLEDLFSSSSIKTYLLLFEIDMLHSSKARKEFSAKLAYFINSKFNSSKDKMIIVVTKIDQHEKLSQGNKFDIESIKDMLFNNKDYTDFSNAIKTNGEKMKNVSIIPFSAGSLYPIDIEKWNWIIGSDVYPNRLWEAIIKANKKGWSFFG